MSRAGYLGTPADSVKGKISPTNKRPYKPQVMLTESQASRIKLLSGILSVRECAAVFNVAHTTIERVLNGSWTPCHRRKKEQQSEVQYGVTEKLSRQGRYNGDRRDWITCWFISKKEATEYFHSLRFDGKKLVKRTTTIEVVDPGDTR